MATTTSDLAVQNWFETTLSSSISDSATTIPLNALPTGSQGFLIIEPDNESNREVIFFTSKTASDVVCSSVGDGRGQDGTAAIAHASGSTVRMQITAGYWEALQDGTGLNSGALSGTPFATGWVTSALPAVSSVTCNGNHSYDVTFASTVAATLTPGMRLRLSRTVAAPTQCTDLEASSSQYYSRASASVAGMTFTDDFVVSAWIKVESYTDYGTIASRYNGTSGWELRVISDGRVDLIGFNGGAANHSFVRSYQSVPLGKWVHIAAQLDMSAFTATTTTSYVMIDGVDVPAAVTRAGTNPTALVQAGDLQIGASNGSAEHFDGKIAQVAIYSAKVTQANIRATISQGLSGSETSLISAYSFNNSIVDLNANANNLTANGSAVATNADSPFAIDANGTPGGTYEWGIVMKVSTTTATVQTPEGSAIPTSGGVSAVAMSAYKAPYGFPSGKDKWGLVLLHRVAATQSAPAVGTWYNVGNLNFTLPIGSWDLSQSFLAYGSDTAGAAVDAHCSLSTSSNSESDVELSTRSVMTGASGAVLVGATLHRNKPVSVSAATIYYVIAKNGMSGTVDTLGIGSDSVPGIIRAECAHL